MRLSLIRLLIFIGKAVALDAELRYCPCQHECGGPIAPFQDRVDPVMGAVEVLVTIGLFTIIKLFRLVNLTVESRGFCIPTECEELSPLNPCEFFDTLEFPMNIFAPPQKEDFGVLDAAVSPASRDFRNNGEHHCDCDRGRFR